MDDFFGGGAKQASSAEQCRFRIRIHQLRLQLQFTAFFFGLIFLRVIIYGRQSRAADPVSDRFPFGGPIRRPIGATGCQERTCATQVISLSCTNAAAVRAHIPTALVHRARETIARVGNKQKYKINE